MITIDYLESEWKTDSLMHITNLDVITVSVPTLHAKYISLLSKVKMDTLKIEREFLKLRRLRTAYYNGSLDRATLITYDWEQYQEKKPLISQLDALLQSDEYLMDTRMKIEELTIAKEFLESVMKSIHSRTYDVKNCLEWLKYSNGMS